MEAHVSVSSQEEAETDFTSIDWLREYVREHTMARFIQNSQSTSNFWNIFQAFVFRNSTWMIILIIGVVTGLSESFLRVGVDLFSDLREGICTENIILSKEDCCWSSNSYKKSSYFSSCDEWKSWSALFRLSGFVSSTIVDLIIFNILSIFYVLYSAFLVQQLAPFAQSSGIPEIKTILGGYVVHGYLGFITFVVKLATLVPTVASGLVVGQEGPMVHIGACIANLACRLFSRYRNNDALKREMISTGVASGVAVAFRSPIGGLLFAIEEVSSFFNMYTTWISFVCSLIGVIVITILNSGLGYLPLYYIRLNQSWRNFEIPIFIFLGVLGGTFGALFTKFALFRNKRLSSTVISRYPILEACILAILSSSLNFTNIFSRTSLHHLVNNLFRYKVPPIVDRTHIPTKISEIFPELGQIAQMIILKSLLMFVTFGVKLPTGIFLPSLAVGSSVGHFVYLLVSGYIIISSNNSFVKYICVNGPDRCTTDHIYAIAGAAAFLAGTSQMTATIVVIMFELTGSTSSIFPIMMSVMVSKWISSALLKEGLYDTLIRWTNYPFLDNKEESTLTSTAGNILSEKSCSWSSRSYELDCGPECLKSVSDTRLVYIPVETFTDYLYSLLKTTKFKGFPLVDISLSSENPCILGFIHREDLHSALAFKESRLGYHSSSLNLNRNENDEHESYPVTFAKCSSLASRDNVDARSYNFSHIIDSNIILIDESTPADIICIMFKKLGVSKLIVTKYGSTLRGIITKSDLINHIKNTDLDSHPTDGANYVELTISV